MFAHEQLAQTFLPLPVASGTDDYTGRHHKQHSNGRTEHCYLDGRATCLHPACADGPNGTRRKSTVLRAGGEGEGAHCPRERQDARAALAAGPVVFSLLLSLFSFFLVLIFLYLIAVDRVVVVAIGHALSVVLVAVGRIGLILLVFPQVQDPGVDPFLVLLPRSRERGSYKYMHGFLGPLLLITAARTAEAFGWGSVSLAVSLRTRGALSSRKVVRPRLCMNKALQRPNQAS